MGLSLSEAAQQAGVSKEVILRAVHKGRLTVTKSDRGLYTVRPDELSEVWSHRLEDVANNDDDPSQVDEFDHEIDEPADLETQVVQLRRRLDEMKSALANEREESDRWKQQAESLLQDAQSRPKKRGWMGFGI